MNFSLCKNQMLLFLRLMQRDWYQYKNRILSYYLINYAFIYPAMYSLSFGYLQANLFFNGADPLRGTTLFVGNFLLVVIVVSSNLGLQLLFDLEHERTIDYLMTIAPARLIIIEKILFTSLFTFFILSPYYPVAKLLLGSFFLTSSLSIPKTVIMLYASCLMCSAYNHLVACVLPGSDGISRFWRRVNTPLFMLGGFWVPFYVVKQFSSLLGTIALLNPFLYITEGMRQAVLNSSLFMSFERSLFFLICFTGIFICAALRVFKRRVDHI
ncbi:MAG: ABC transporter permease [Candidatus Dependentiae bacterium]|nr:ABC transporter permease [Candidatus Dependentiae bacterium]